MLIFIENLNLLLSKIKDPVPTITAIVRNSFGRYLWHFELRDLPRSKAGLKVEEKDPGRPLPGREKPKKPKKNLKFYPDAADKIPKCKMCVSTSVSYSPLFFGTQPL
jgi:hypothetical protein